MKYLYVLLFIVIVSVIPAVGQTKPVSVKVIRGDNIHFPINSSARIKGGMDLINRTELQLACTDTTSILGTYTKWMLTVKAYEQDNITGLVYEKELDLRTIQIQVTFDNITIGSNTDKPALPVYLSQIEEDLIWGELDATGKMSGRVLISYFCGQNPSFNFINILGDEYLVSLEFILTMF